jgi:hypothetical protein
VTTRDGRGSRIERHELERGHPAVTPTLRFTGLVAGALAAFVVLGTASPGQDAPVAPPHWAFVPPVRETPPHVADATWVRNGVDRWVLARLEREGLRPTVEADRHALLRRVTLDLIGLPPTPKEIAAAIADPGQDWYDRVVDRLLASPRFGERWARVWLDLARYADSLGYASDPLREIWRYRDWVIDAFNRNLPYDRFTIEQLAGDLLPDPSADALLATAFHRNTMTNTEGGTDDEEFRVAAVKDRTNTTAQVWMGLTLGCAQCHSHKFDPISHEEYYGVFAFFNQTEDTDQPDDRPRIPTPTREQVEWRRAQEARLSALEARVGDPVEELDRGMRAHRGIRARARLNTLPSLLAEIHGIREALRRDVLPTTPIMRELSPDRRRPTHLMVRGNFLVKGKTVEPGTPSALHPWPEGQPTNRLGLARWIMDPGNPLTARVAVNRFFGQLFGRGIVETEEDFGTQGSPPSHQDLLDWLAVTFRDDLRWDTKALLRLLVTSSTYRQDARGAPDVVVRDPRNRLLARASRRRLEAEMVRDQALAVSDLLSPRLFGPSVFPPQPEGLWQAAFNGADRTWPTSAGEDRHRRALYTFLRRTVPYPSLATFDMPSREVCLVRRLPTNTPLQALVTLNDPAFVEAAKALARRILRDGGAGDASRVSFGVLLCLQRPAEAREVEVLVDLLSEERLHFSRNQADALALAKDPVGSVPDGITTEEVAAWTVVANVLLNLDGAFVR